MHFYNVVVIFLGHEVGRGKVLPIEAKVKAISEFPSPHGKKQLMRLGDGPLYNPYKCCLGVCLATCRSLNNVYTATSICMARNTVRPVHHLDC